MIVLATTDLQYSIDERMSHMQERFRSFVQRSLDQLYGLWATDRLQLHDLHHVLYPVEEKPVTINEVSPLQVRNDGVCKMLSELTACHFK